MPEAITIAYRFKLAFDDRAKHLTQRAAFNVVFRQASDVEIDVIDVVVVELLELLCEILI